MLDKTEKWYGTQYNVERLSESFLKVNFITIFLFYHNLVFKFC